MPNRTLHASALISILLFAVPAFVCSAQDWDQFRGPNGNGIATDSSLPTNFSEGNTVWKTAIPGTGWSSPVIANGRIWLTTAETTKATKDQIAKKTRNVQFANIKTAAASVKLKAICVDAASGKIVHNILLSNVSDPELINPLNSYASPTSTIEGDRVICHFGTYGTWCLNSSSGETLWENALEIDHSVGPGSSPVIADGIVLLVCDGIDKQFIAGLDLQSGKEVWRTPRPTISNSNGEFRKAYSTPLLIQVGEEPQAVIPGAQWVCAYDPKSGREIWRADCGAGFSTTPMAIYESGLLVCSTGYMLGELVAIDPRGSGNISKTNIAWSGGKGGSTMPTGVGKAGKIYSINDDGVLSTIDATTGDVTNRIRVGGKFASSPLLVGSKLYLASREGVMSVFSLDGAKPKQLSKAQLDGSLMASPAVIGSDLVIRTSKSLIRFRN